MNLRNSIYSTLKWLFSPPSLLDVRFAKLTALSMGHLRVLWFQEISGLVPTTPTMLQLLPPLEGL